MNTPRDLPTTPHDLEPAPMHRHGHRKPPLEMRTNWDPWLPAHEAYPEVAAPLRLIAAIILVLLTFLYAMIFLALFSA